MRDRWLQRAYREPAGEDIFRVLLVLGCKSSTTTLVEIKRRQVLRESLFACDGYQFPSVTGNGAVVSLGQVSYEFQK